MALALQEIISKLEEAMPLALQESYDNCGLQVGSRKSKVKKILFALDASREVVREAIAKKCQLIVTHHPLLMSGIKRVDTDSYEGSVIELAIQNKIAIYSAHTNHDSSAYSLSRKKAEELGLSDIQKIASAQLRPYLKLIIFVPKTHTSQVAHALFKAGAGQIGKYSHCSFRSSGTGTFLGGKDTDPFLGKPGKLEEANEDRLEVILPQKAVDSVVKVLHQVHPYEEVAYDLIALSNEVPGAGLGALGKLPQPILLKKILPKIKKIFQVKNVRLVGDLNRKIQMIGICTGSGSSLWKQAKSLGCDLFLTGDVKYHTAVEVLRENFAMIDLGHFGSEIESVNILKQLLEEKFGKELQYFSYRKLKDPFYQL